TESRGRDRGLERLRESCLRSRMRDVLRVHLSDPAPSQLDARAAKSSRTHEPLELGAIECAGRAMNERHAPILADETASSQARLLVNDLRGRVVQVLVERDRRGLRSFRMRNKQLRINVGVEPEHAPMDMRSGGAPRMAGSTDDIALLHLLPFMHVD